MEDPVKIWSPDILENVDEIDLDLYLEFTTSACIPGANCNIEEAFEILHECKGDIKMATWRLLNDKENPIRNKTIWTLTEVQMFGALIIIHGKNFHLISQTLGKTVKDCVKLYYLWKRSHLRSVSYAATDSLITPETSISNRSHDITRTPESTTSGDASINHTTHINNNTYIIISNNSSNNHSISSSSSSGGASGSNNNNNSNPSNNSLNQNDINNNDEKFPCRVCGIVFDKIKSRSAHMKRHKHERR